MGGCNRAQVNVFKPVTCSVKFSGKHHLTLFCVVIAAISIVFPILRFCEIYRAAKSFYSETERNEFAWYFFSGANDKR